MGLQATLANHVVAGIYAAEDVKKAGCVVLPTLLGGSIRAMYLEGDHDHDGDDHGYIMINEAKVVLADIADDTNIFHGIDTVLLSEEAFECPTEAPVAPPTAADEKDEKESEKENEDEDEEKESSASVTGFSAAMIAIVALSTFVLREIS